jgi:hypothetical protein
MNFSRPGTVIASPSPITAPHLNYLLMTALASAILQSGFWVGLSASVTATSETQFSQVSTSFSLLYTHVRKR